MKTLFASFLFISLSAAATTIEVDVLSAEFGVLDHLNQKTLCLTSVRIPATGELLGVVESIQDCYYARMARRSPTQKIQVSLDDLRPFEILELEQHLQTYDTQLKFLFSYGE